MLVCAFQKALALSTASDKSLLCGLAATLARHCGYTTRCLRVLLQHKTDKKVTLAALFSCKKTTIPNQSALVTIFLATQTESITLRITRKLSLSLLIAGCAAMWWLAGLYLYLSPNLPEADTLRDVKLQDPYAGF